MPECKVNIVQIEPILGRRRTDFDIAEEFCVLEESIESGLGWLPVCITKAALNVKMLCQHRPGRDSKSLVRCGNRWIQREGKIDEMSQRVRHGVNVDKVSDVDAPDEDRELAIKEILLPK